MKVTAIKIAKRANASADASVIADVSVVLDDCLLLRGLKIMDGLSGLFIGYPTDRTRDYSTYIVPITRELREHIETAILERYQLGELDPMDAGFPGK